jgi:hypothetical protein
VRSPADGRGKLPGQRHLINAALNTLFLRRPANEKVGSRNSRAVEEDGGRPAKMSPWQ